MKTVAVLGATGSIGTQALEIIGDHPGLRAVALSAHRDAASLAALAARHDVSLVALTDADAARSAPGIPLAGEQGLLELVRRSDADIVLNAIVGAAGLRATLAALEAGADLALANKESLVAGGPLVTAAARRAGRMVLPVDSEHSAAYQCLEGRSAEQVDSLVLTGSGGPFRGRARDELEDVAPEEALAHPTWSMGPKITIDSATLANKGLELIEAHFLFGIPYDRIEVVLQPTSVVHALVRFRDGASLAHLGYPDMRVPIAFALTYPDRAATPVPALDFSQGLVLEFEPPDLETFPLLALARQAGERGATFPCAFNAANEVAVAAFLEGRLPFLGIASTVEETLAEVDGAPARDLDELVEADREARRLAERASVA